VLTTQQGYIIAPAMLADPELVNEPIGTGPFKFESHVKDEYWQFSKNESYWRDGLPHLDTLEIKPIPDNATRVSALKSGDIDMMNTRWPADIVELRTSDFKIVENASGEEEFLVLNTSTPPFDNPTARQAVAYATDTDRWEQEIGLGVDPAVDSPFAPGQLGYLDDNGYPAYDLDKAKELVQQYQNETGQPLNFELVTQADVNVVAESQLLTEMYSDAGMTVTVTALPQINLIAQIASGTYQMGRFRLFSSANPDVDANAFWRSGSVLPPPDISLNFPHYADPTVDDAIVTAIASTDEGTRREAFETINRQFATNQPYIWLGRTVWMLAASPRVNGIYAAKNGTIETIGAKTWLADLWLSQ
jgi:peptide/nickel transport system substrate-binding protein